MTHHFIGLVPRKLAQVGLREHAQPMVHTVVAFEWRWPVEQAGVANFQAVALQNACVLPNARVIPGRLYIGARAKYSTQGGLNGSNVAFASELRDKTASTAERACDGRGGAVGVLHPM